MATVKRYLSVVFLSLTVLAGIISSDKASANGYAMLAKAALEAPVVAKIVVIKQKQPPKEQRSIVPGQTRLIIEADVLVVLKAPDLVPSRITYMWEGPLNPSGKQPNFKKLPFIVFLFPDSDRDVNYRLASESAQQSWSDPDEQTLRQIIKEAATNPTVAARMISSVRSGLVDTSEDASDIINFIVDAKSGNSAVLSLQGDKILFTNSDGIADGLPIQPRTLTWYQLACGLPASLPDQVIEDQENPDDANKLRGAYAKIHQQLGACE